MWHYLGPHLGLMPFVYTAKKLQSWITELFSCKNNAQTIGHNPSPRQEKFWPHLKLAILRPVQRFDWNCSKKQAEAGQGSGCGRWDKPLSHKHQRLLWSSTKADGSAAPSKQGLTLFHLYLPQTWEWLSEDFSGPSEYRFSQSTQHNCLVSPVAHQRAFVHSAQLKSQHK